VQRGGGVGGRVGWCEGGSGKKGTGEWREWGVGRGVGGVRGGRKWGGVESGGVVGEGGVGRRGGEGVRREC